MNKEYIYDLIIVGSGLYGMVFAYNMKNSGYKCLVIEKRNHLGGNIYNEKIENIHIHKYGPHIFHTNNAKIWKFVTELVDFNNYIYSPIASYNNIYYNLPFNMNTFNKIWGVVKPKDAMDIIKKQSDMIDKNNINNLEDQAISLVGKDVYEILIKGYTKKQWGRDPKELPIFIIKRLPVRYTYNNNYFNDKYQGIPEGGYNTLIDKLLNGIEVKINTDYFSNKQYFDSIAKNILFTGKIDEFYNYSKGKLEYRTLKYENEIIGINNYQGISVINYTSESEEYTRIIEHKHFSNFNVDIPLTVISKEYPSEYIGRNEPFYPINDQKNNQIYKYYRDLSLCDHKYIFGGRLAEYKYYDMHQVIESALKKSEQYIKKNNDVS